MWIVLFAEYKCDSLSIITVQNHKRLSFDFDRWFFFVDVLTKCVHHLHGIKCHDFFGKLIIREPKNQLSWLFEIHSPWLICYRFDSEARLSLSGIEIWCQYKPLISIGNGSRWQKGQNRKRQSERGECCLSANGCFSPSIEQKKTWYVAIVTVSLSVRLPKSADLVHVVDSWQKLSCKTPKNEKKDTFSSHIEPANSKQK